VGTEAAVAHFPQEFSDAFRFLQHIGNVRQAVAAVCRIIMERQSLLDIDDGIDTEPGKAFVQPPVDHLIDFFPKLRILPVQVRLLFVKDMQIVTVLVSRQLFPDRSSEIRSPVAGKLFPFLHCLDIEKLSVFSVRIPAGLLKPLVLIGAVVHDQVHYDPDASLFCLGDQFIHILHRPEPRVDPIVIRNVVALISQR